MTSLDLTEQEVFRIISKPSTFDDVVSEVWTGRKMRGVRPGSLSTISRALKSLHQKRFASYDVTDRTWLATSLGNWIMGERRVPSKSALALSRVTEPLLDAVRKNPESLIELLSGMLEYSFGRRGRLSEQEAMILKQTEAKLTLFIKEYPAAIEAIWGDGVERLVGGFSGLMAAILLYRSSLAPDYRTQASAAPTISKIAHQYFKSLSVELGEFLSSSLADLDKLAALDRKVKEARSHQTPKKTHR